MVWLITRHTFLSLGWDEWASIVAILTAISVVIRYLTKKAKDDLLGETNKQLRILNHNMEVSNRHQEKIDARLERGDRKMADHEVRLQDHERRIKRLEEE